MHYEKLWLAFSLVKPESQKVLRAFWWFRTPITAFFDFSIPMSFSIANEGGRMVFINESNNTIATAFNTGISGAVQYYIAEGTIGDNLPEGNPFDVDILKVDLQAGQTLAVDIDALFIGSSLSSYLRLFQADGQEITSAWGGYDDPYLTYVAQTTGSYFIGVSSDGNYSYNPNENSSGDNAWSTGDYTLTIDVIPNQIPVAFADEISAPPNTTTIIPGIQLWGNDYDPDYWDTIQIHEVIPGDGTSQVELGDNGTILFTPQPGTKNTDVTFSYTLTDNFGNISQPATVTVHLGNQLQGTNWRRDRLFGTDRADKIEGKGNNDALVGLDGDDLLLGGSGRDTLNGGFGIDRLVGGADADLLLVHSGEDTVVLEKFSDSRLKSPDVIRVRPDVDYYYGSYAHLNIDAPGEQLNSLYSSPSFLVTDSLRESDIKDLLEVLDPDNNYFSLGIATFQYTDSKGKTRDFLAIDNGVLVDGHRSFSASKDSIIELQGGASFYNISIS